MVFIRLPRRYGRSSDETRCNQGVCCLLLVMVGGTDLCVCFVIAAGWSDAS